MMFYELECGVIINLSMIVQIDKDEGTITMADGTIWHINNEEIDAITKKINL